MSILSIQEISAHLIFYISIQRPQDDNLNYFETQLLDPD